jgi:hypothetical protein
MSTCKVEGPQGQIFKLLMVQGYLLVLVAVTMDSEVKPAKEMAG